MPASSGQPAEDRRSYLDGVVRWRRHRHGLLGRGRLPGRPRHRAAAGLSGLNLDLEWFNFGRLRPAAHLGGDLRLRRQRADRHLLLCRAAHLPRAALPAAASPGSCSGATSCSSCWPPPAICSASPQGKEYAEPEWYVDLWLTVVWVAYLLVFVGTLVKRKEPHIYVANWFYLAFIVTIAMLHLVNNLSMPVVVLRLEELLGCSPACRMR